MIEKMLQERKLPPLKSREEMLEMLLKEEYGPLPPKPERLEWVEEPLGKTGVLYGGKAIRKRVTLTAHFEGKSFTFPFWSTVPADEGKHPYFIHINFRAEADDRYQPTEEIIDGGFAVLNFSYLDVTSDNNDFTNGLAGVLYPEGKRGPQEAGKIAMWSWAAQRVMDYAMEQKELDHSCACVCGHSRLGKTALLTGATDKRFAFTHSNDSGNCGAAISRDKEGERIADITKSFPHWFTEEVAKYAGQEQEMPFEQHFLIASSAARKVHISSATEDLWADPVSEYLCTLAASPAFESGMPAADRLPLPNERITGRDLGYFLRGGGHAFCRQDWQAVMEFIKRSM